ncbi:MAG: hypothetical protein Q8N99_05450 [Nanoarchaeota archaeon]|nr:hypothetical protein [Nanoarchaeota archaeon]
MPLDYQLGEGIKRIDGIMLSDFDSGDISLDSIVALRGYINAESRSEYHFMFGFDPRCPPFSVFCDDPIHGSNEHLAVLKKLSARLNTEINPATGEGHFVKPQDKKVLTNIITGIFDDFGVPDEQRSIVVDYKTT